MKVASGGVAALEAVQFSGCGDEILLGRLDPGVKRGIEVL
jgi:hypothetical protein